MFVYWMFKGIDWVICEFYGVVWWFGWCDYEVWIFSDYG